LGTLDEPESLDGILLVDAVAGVGAIRRWKESCIGAMLLGIPVVEPMLGRRGTGQGKRLGTVWQKRHQLHTRS
jgi:hypothetical protein